MNRWGLVSVCVILGVVMLGVGLLVPAHLRTVDSSIIEQAGRNTAALVDRGVELVQQKKIGAAQMLLQAAQREKISGYGPLRQVVDAFQLQHPDLQPWGGEKPAGLPRYVSPAASGGTNAPAEPFTEIIIRLDNREPALQHLAASSAPATRELLRFRSATNTALFPPSESASGQALDAALAIAGLLLDGGHLAPGLSNAVFNLAAAANRGNPAPFEQMLMNFMSLGQRFNWGQLSVFVRTIEDPETLRLQANLARTADRLAPVLFSAVELSGKPAAVARYLTTFSQTGLDDLSRALRYGEGGVNELLARNQRLTVSESRWRLAVNSCLRTPWFALSLKWLSYLLAGFLLALALHFARPAVPTLERPLQVRGFHVAREILFALGFLLVVLLVSEPFLAQESQKTEFPFRLRLPTVGSAVPAGTSATKSTFMNPEVLLTMLFFFVLQALLYAACLFKLAEIRRQRVPARIKLKLLDNEDHLFDAGLYLGFVGTIISLILVSLGVFKQPSLMAAYSATSFGIIFVSVFKILHLRPTRRRLLLEAEVNAQQQPATPAPQTFAAPL